LNSGNMCRKGQRVPVNIILKQFRVLDRFTQATRAHKRVSARFHPRDCLWAFPDPHSGFKEYWSLLPEFDL